MKKYSLDPLPLQFLFCIFIAVSAAFILIPGVRVLPYAKLGPGLMAVTLFVFMICRDMKSGAYKLTPREIYARAKEGQKFAPGALELATDVAVMIAFWKTF